MTCESKKFKTEREREVWWKRKLWWNGKLHYMYKTRIVGWYKLEENDNITSTSASNERKHARNVMMFDSNKNFPSNSQLEFLYIYLLNAHNIWPSRLQNFNGICNRCGFRLNQLQRNHIFTRHSTQMGFHVAEPSKVLQRPSTTNEQRQGSTPLLLQN